LRTTIAFSSLWMVIRSFSNFFFWYSFNMFCPYFCVWFNFILSCSHV
jgi:hypothetical protein